MLFSDLFAGSLYHVLVMPQHHAKARGYFAPSALLGASRKTAGHELAMNSDNFTGPHRRSHHVRPRARNSARLAAEETFENEGD